MEGDSKALAERHAIEHAESIHVPAKKMGLDVFTNGFGGKVSSTLHSSSCAVTELGLCTCSGTTVHGSPVDPYGSQRLRREASAKAHQPTGIGGAPTRATTFPEDAAGRKQHPVASGVLDYFPDALVALARVSWAGNEQHNPGQPLHWAREKSTDEADALMRHFLERGTIDGDGMRHTAKMAWRALAMLQKEIEGERK